MKNKKKHSVKSRIFRIILIVLSGVIVGFSVYSWNATRVANNQLPMPLGFGASVVLTGSMEPTLKENDLVFVTGQDEYNVGDIVVYQENSTLIIHRVVAKDGEIFITKGDANNIEDDPIELKQIKGKMALRIPFLGLVFKFVKSLPGTLIILALAVFLMYRSRRKETKKNDKDLEAIVEEIRALQAQQAGQQAASQPADGSAQQTDAPAKDPEEPAANADAADADDTAEDSAEDNTQTAEESAPQSQPDENAEAESDGADDASSQEAPAAEEENMDDSEDCDDSEDSAAEEKADADSDEEAAADNSEADSEITELNSLIEGIDD